MQLPMNGGSNPSILIRIVILQTNLSGGYRNGYQTPASHLSTGSRSRLKEHGRESQICLR